MILESTIAVRRYSLNLKWGICCKEFQYGALLTLRNANIRTFTRKATCYTRLLIYLSVIMIPRFPLFNRLYLCKGMSYNRRYVMITQEVSGKYEIWSLFITNLTSCLAVSLTSCSTDPQSMAQLSQVPLQLETSNSISPKWASCNARRQSMSFWQ